MTLLWAYSCGLSLLVFWFNIFRKRKDCSVYKWTICLLNGINRGTSPMTGCLCVKCWYTFSKSSIIMIHADTGTHIFKRIICFELILSTLYKIITQFTDNFIESFEVLKQSQIVWKCPDLWCIYSEWYSSTKSTSVTLLSIHFYENKFNALNLSIVDIHEGTAQFY